MKPALRVLAPGLMTTLQDLGRRGYQSLGIPVSGALDLVALAAANALVGNPPFLGNKKMIAEHLQELLRIQKETGSPFLYEAAACASIPATARGAT